MAPTSIEFADPAGGLRGWIGRGLPGLAPEQVAALVVEGDQVLVAGPVEGATLSAEDGRARAKLKSGEIALEVEVNAAAVAGPLNPGRARVELSVGGRARIVEARGSFDALVDGTGERGELLRTVVALREDGSTLALRSVRPAGAAEHGAERAEAWLLDPDATEARSVGEALLSTEYDEGGIQTRAGLELWLAADDQVPLRGAGVRRAGAGLELDGWRLEAAFFDWTIEGVEGAGSYMIWRRAS